MALDLEVLRKKLDDALVSETKESFEKWFEKTRIETTEKDVLNRNYHFHIDGNKLIIQNYSYMDSGWYVEVDRKKVSLYEVWEGNKPQKYGDYDTILEALKDTVNLS